MSLLQLIEISINIVLIILKKPHLHFWKHINVLQYKKPVLKMSSQMHRYIYKFPVEFCSKRPAG